MNLKEAFPVCMVTVIPDEGGGAAAYCVVRVEDSCVCLETLMERLVSPAPGPGAGVTLQASAAEGVFQARGVVVDRLTLHHVQLVVRIQGDPRHVQRRARSRLAVRLPIRLERPTPTGAETWEGVTLDANSRGVRIASDWALNVGETLRVAVADAGRCAARVVRCAPAAGGGYEAGLLFLDMRPEDEERLVAAILDRAFNVSGRDSTAHDPQASGPGP